MRVGPGLVYDPRRFIRGTRDLRRKQTRIGMLPPTGQVVNMMPIVSLRDPPPAPAEPLIDVLFSHVKV